MSVLTVAAFVLTQGVNVGSLYDPTDYLAGTIADLTYLGVKHARAGWTPGVAGWYSYAQAGSIAALAKLDVLANSANVVNGPDASLISQLGSFAAAYPGALEYVEGLNEINNQPVLYDGSGGYVTGSTECGSTYYSLASSANAGGSSELAAAVSYQQEVYDAVIANGSLTGVGVIGFTGYDAGSPVVTGCAGSDPVYVAAIPNTTDMISGGYATVDNSHFYPTGAPSTTSLATAFPILTTGQLAAYQASGQLVYTETGYNSYYYSSATQAQYTLDLLLDDAKNQVAVSYLFTLNDGDGSDLYGLFTAYDDATCANCAKPAATAIHNLNAVLLAGNTGAVPHPNFVGYTVSGETASSFDLEMTQTSGSSALALWNEGTGSVTESVTLAVESNIVVYDPIVGTAPIAAYSGVTAFNVTLGSDPVVAVLTPLNCH